MHSWHVCALCLGPCRPYRLDQMASGAAGVSDASDGASGAAGGGGGAGDASGNTLVIDELWRAGKELRPILEALGIHSDTLFTASVSVGVHTVTHTHTHTQEDAKGHIKGGPSILRAHTRPRVCVCVCVLAQA